MTDSRKMSRSSIAAQGAEGGGQVLKSILLVVALAAAALAGCVDDDRGEAKKLMAGAAEEVESYRFEIEMDQTVEYRNFSGQGSLEGEKVALWWQGEINLTDNSSMEAISSKRTTLAGDRTADDAVEVYFLNDTRYQRMGGEWIGLLEPDPVHRIENSDQLAHLLEMIERAEVEVAGTERVGGDRVRRLKVVPDDDTAFGIMLGQISSIDPRIPLMIDMNVLMERGTELEWTVLVSEETGLPTESRISAVYSAGPGVLRVPPEAAGGMEIVIETTEVRRFGGYGEPVTIILPEEARAAPILPPDLPEGEDPEPLT